MLVDLQTCKPTTPTQAGSNSSNGTVRTASTMFRTRRFLMLLEVKTKKPPTFKFGRRTALRPNHGSLPMKVIWRSKPRDSTKISDFKLRNHSSSSQRCGWTELSNALELIIWDSRLWEHLTKDNNSSWMIRLRPFSQTNGKADLSPSKAMVTLPTCTWLPLMLDGSNFSDSKVTCLSTTKERSCKLMETLILKTETLESTTKTAKLVRHGTSSTSMKCQQISKRVT